VINSGNIDDQELPLALWREDRLTVRMRPTFPADSPEDVRARAAANFPHAGRAVGDDWFRPLGFGERIGGGNTMSENFLPTARAIAEVRWPLQQHSISREENQFHIETFEAIDRELSIQDLRWSLIHLQDVDESILDRLGELSAGASAQTWTYLSAAGGPPFRRIVDSGIPTAVGTDSTNVSALDPWLTLFYMTTGRNLAGELTNDGQQLSRTEALGLYTMGSAWFAFDDHQLGSFDTGKWADLAVLDRDYLSVPDAEIREIESLLTLVGGRVTHARDPFASLAG
jgi:predicted amidohydrolase YtcJ